MAWPQRAELDARRAAAVQLGMTALERMAAWAHALRLSDVPPRVVEQAKNQVLSILAAAHAGYASDLGPPIAEAFPGPPGDACAVPAGTRTTPAHAAFLSAAWSMVLDFDDSMLGGHVGHGAVLVPFAYAGGREGAELLEAQICATEIAARVNTAVALGPLRGQMATHVHLLAAAAARARLERCGPGRFAEALGFALSYPARALYPGFLGSDAKVLCASWPIRMGLESVDAVLAGLRGNAGILEGGQGFIARFADVPVPAFLEGLGERWHTETNSFKVYPACAYIDAVLDATLEIVGRHDVRPEDVEAVDVHASVFTIGMDARSAPYLRGPDSLVPTLSFSTPYNVACAIRDRKLTPEHYTRPRIADRSTWDLAARVRLHHDPELTKESLLATAPVGAAFRAAGKDGLGYVRRMGGDDDIVAAVEHAADGRVPDLARATKAVGATVRITTSRGAYEHTVRIPAGAAGSDDRGAVRGLMLEKFAACAGATVGAEQAREASPLVERLDELGPDEVWRLVRLNCLG